MRDDKITLDKKALGALSSDTRANILKSIDVRRMTVSELSKELNLPKSTIHENLDRLVDADLVKKNDDNNTNRVYYELTERGITILHPHEMTKIIILLSSAALSFVGGIIEIYWFIKSTFPGLKDAEEIVPLYEPKYLIFGVILLSLGVLFLYLLHRSMRGRATEKVDI
ncbi:MAG: winged helix-turn-helix domain-containing protein [Euryarchaeota archaeon]|nr:winged helix-turn-helix domain-containing protein [Euryarchaeota archaeon]